MVGWVDDWWSECNGCCYNSLKPPKTVKSQAKQNQWRVFSPYGVCILYLPQQQLLFLILFVSSVSPKGCMLSLAGTTMTSIKIHGTQRRQVLFQTVLAAFSFPPILSLALADSDTPGDFRLYADEANKFKIMIPQDWQVGAGDNNGVKSVTGFFPDEPSSSNVTVVITGLGADFTRLESFGKVDAFAENLVSGLDRSWQRPPGVRAKLIDSKTANGLYYIEYTLQNPGQSCRHLISVLGIANNGWYNRLYTVTGQFVDEDSEKYGSKIEKAVSSFRLN
ncbi:hypothetical protein HYC85_008708 [Camellia sinensis]|uniref:PsbP C-terminal domain-containing protein n=1 Tax=Camellia sinensis TaxID=4442 RepID=A0A7J7HSL3_CAMSI|nr:hypothetical protein HYC85_008708 [Camellia sinensis]